MRRKLTIAKVGNYAKDNDVLIVVDMEPLKRTCVGGDKPLGGDDF